MLRSLEEKVDPRHAAVVVVDVQNDFCADDGAMARIGRPVATVQAMVPVLQRSARRRARRRCAGHLRAVRPHERDGVGGSPRAADARALRHGHLPAGDLGRRVLRRRAGAGRDRRARSTATAASSAPISIVILRSTGRRVLIMTGIATNGCVEATARDGFMHDYYIVLVDDCCSCFSPELHQATLQNIRDAYGVVTTADELSGIWTRSRAPVTSG